MNVETEIKYSIPIAGLVADIFSDSSISSQAIPGTYHRFLVEAHYLDSDDLDLLDAGIACRVRKEGNKWVATVKKGGDNKTHIQQRQEWNIDVPAMSTDICLFANTEIGDELKQVIGDKSLRVLFTCHFERKSMVLRLKNDTLVELAVDVGEIVASASREAICEIELELKKGDFSEMLQLASFLSERYSLQAEPRSKFSRGLCLLGVYNS